MLEGWGDRMSFPKSVFPTLLFVGTAAGVTDHVWSVADIVTIIETTEPAPAKQAVQRPPEAHMRRYVVRRQENRQYCIWDTKTAQPAEADGRRYVNLQFDEALNFVELLNGAKNSN